MNCCRTCQHFVANQTPVDCWCQLRRLKVTPDLAAYAFCHHWTAGSPLLPELKTQTTASSTNQQLEIGKTLVTAQFQYKNK